MSGSGGMNLMGSVLGRGVVEDFGAPPAAARPGRGNDHRQTRAETDGLQPAGIGSGDQRAHLVRIFVEIEELFAERFDQVGRDQTLRVLRLPAALKPATLKPAPLKNVRR